MPGVVVIVQFKQGAVYTYESCFISLHNTRGPSPVKSYDSVMLFHGVDGPQFIQPFSIHDSSNSFFLYHPTNIFTYTLTHQRFTFYIQAPEHGAVCSIQTFLPAPAYFAFSLILQIGWMKNSISVCSSEHLPFS